MVAVIEIKFKPVQRLSEADFWNVQLFAKQLNGRMHIRTETPEPSLQRFITVSSTPSIYIFEFMDMEAFFEFNLSFQRFFKTNP